jgi:DNA-binding response OmpR family regulator
LIPNPVKILLVEDNREFANLVQLFLQKAQGATFHVIWRDNGKSALAEVDKDPDFHVILMDYFLPGQNGLEITRELKNRGINTPVVFLTVNKDFDLAVEVMKLGVEDYLVKEEISTPVLPRTILSVIERRELREQLTQLEFSQKRLETIKEHVEKITREVRLPLDEMRTQIDSLSEGMHADNLQTYITIIRDNLSRIEKKIVQLKGIQSDRTVPYVEGVRMFDLSEAEGKSEGESD